jgi:hypothetical protein
MKTSSTNKSGRLGRGVLDSRRERLAAALRDNLRKRKSQARVRERSNNPSIEGNLRQDGVSE